MIYKPQQEFDSKLKHLHLEHTNQFFEDLVQRSGVNPEENKRTVKRYKVYNESLRKLKRKLTWLRILRVLLCITLLLIPLVIFALNPKIKALRAEIGESEKKAAELLYQAYRE